jgi:hypothetical protein
MKLINKTSMKAIIDADSIGYMFGWTNREHTNVEPVLEAVDSMLLDMLSHVGADQYVGTLSAKDCFRKEVYKVQKYKGNRPPKEPWAEFWCPVIEQHLTDSWQFITLASLEADDICCAMAILHEDVVICSPDKDLRQVPGRFYDFSAKNKDRLIETVSPEQAELNLNVQFITGDMGDNILGLYKVGPVTAVKALSDLDEFEVDSAITQLYFSHFGEFYGREILAQTRQAIQMVTPRHPQWVNFEQQLKAITFKPVPTYDPFDQ